MSVDGDLIREKLRENESPILEFKREWYWDSTTPKSEMSDKWGELIKDIVSLANGYVGYCGQERYLIIGYSDNEGKIYNVDCGQIKHLDNLRKFTKDIISKLEAYTSPALPGVEIDAVEVDANNLLVIRIDSPFHLIELKSQLKTKTRTLDSGSVLVRKGQYAESVRTANVDEILLMRTEFDEFHKRTQRVVLEKLEVKKERSIEKIIQLFIDKNSTYSLDVNFPIKVADWSGNIVFELFRVSDSFGGAKEFLYLHESSSQGKTLGYLKSHKLVSNFENLVILTETPNLKDADKRKLNISSTFGTRFVYFIEEFGYEFLYKECLLDYVKYNLPVFVDGLVDVVDSEEMSGFEHLKQWYSREGSPLFVIKGHGGIGKTTLAKQFLDYVYDSNLHDVGILFIDSKEIIDELAKIADSRIKIEDIYDFYQAQIGKEDSSVSRFSRDLLKLSVDNGRLLIVLDGIDEVIAKLGTRFDLPAFIDSISDGYSSDIRKAKILITCRDHFWDAVGKGIYLPEITLRPFNRALAKEFFEQAFGSDNSRLVKAMSMAEQFATDPDTRDLDDEIYIPYVLDIIAYLIKRGSDLGSDEELAESSILITDLKSDYIVGRVCAREIKKLESFGLDDQVKLFMEMSVRKDGSVSLYDVKEMLALATGITADERLIEKLKDHPLLVCADNRLSFRYDFFGVYFKMLYVAQFFVRREVEMNATVIRVVGSYVKYGNSFTEALCDRFVFDDDLVIFCVDVIEGLRSYKETDEVDEPGEIESAISSVFMLLVALMESSEAHHFDVASRTKIMEDVFKTAGEIHGLCLVNVFGCGSSKLTFDFRGRVFRGCLFDRYEYFWDCQIDNETRFVSSTFRALAPRAGVRPVVYENTFSSDCSVSDIKEILDRRLDDVKNESCRVKDELTKFFRLFYQRGNFYPKKQEQVRSKVFAAKLLPALLRQGVVRDFVDPKKPTFRQYKISDEYRSIVNYLEQGGPCIELENLVKKISEE